MGKKLVAYFSASGVTKRVAEKMAAAVGADIFEIVPQQPYTDKDLDWHDPKSRSSVEMQDKASRPAIGSRIGNIGEYDTVLIGFPIWWYVAPTIINTFLESYDFSGKKIVLFATSGMSGMGNTTRELKGSAPDADFIAERRLEARCAGISVAGKNTMALCFGRAFFYAPCSGTGAVQKNMSEYLCRQDKFRIAWVKQNGAEETVVPYIK